MALYSYKSILQSFYCNHATKYSNYTKEEKEEMMTEEVVREETIAEVVAITEEAVVVAEEINYRIVKLNKDVTTKKK